MEYLHKYFREYKGQLELITKLPPLRNIHMNIFEILKVNLGWL